MQRSGHEPPGVRRERPRRFRPRLHYELLVCGLVGHALVGLDVREVRPQDMLLARECRGVRWLRCLRCDSWLPLTPPPNATRQHIPAREELELPLRGRPLRDKVVLRLIAIDRALHFLILGLLGAALLILASHRASLRRSGFYKALADLQGGAVTGNGRARHGLLGEVDKLFSLQSSRLHLFAAVLLAYAVVEGVEAVGLWQQRRWAEYLTLLVTASLLPFEVWEMTTRLTPFKVIAFAINAAVVVYLLYAKRLFGLRGGAAAEEAVRERDSGWEALERTAPA